MTSAATPKALGAAHTLVVGVLLALRRNALPDPA
jgi:hypothetical protein